MNEGSEDPMILLESVSYTHTHHDQLPFIHGLSLHIPTGEWVAIAGPNGSGKSTLVKLFNGLLAKKAGRIVIDGIELEPESVASIRDRIGFVFQNPDNQFVGLTVAEDLAFGLENRCLPRETMKERIADYAARLNITELLNRHPSELSGGQKQRVAIAAVLVTEPKIIVLDEATSMLDEHARSEVLDIVRQMHDTGRYTIVSVTHDHEEMLAADRLLILVDGAVAADGPPASIFCQEELLRQSRLKPPFALQLCRELQRRGIDVGVHVDERKLVDALWAYYSKM